MIPEKENPYETKGSTTKKYVEVKLLFCFVFVNTNGVKTD